MKRFIQAKVTNEEIKETIRKYYLDDITDEDITNATKAIEEFETEIKEISTTLNEAYTKLYNNKDLFNKILESFQSSFSIEDELKFIIDHKFIDNYAKILNEFSMEDLASKTFSVCFKDDITKLKNRMDEAYKDIAESNYYDDEQKEILINDPEKFFRELY